MRELQEHLALISAEYKLVLEYFINQSFTGQELKAVARAYMNKLMIETESGYIRY